jgi:hypothetical protein
LIRDRWWPSASWSSLAMRKRSSLTRLRASRHPRRARQVQGPASSVRLGVADDLVDGTSQLAGLVLGMRV